MSIRKNNNLKQSDVAKIINVCPSSIGMYESGLRDMPIKKLVKFANYFDVSVDYILGNSNSKSTVERFLSGETCDPLRIQNLAKLTNNKILELSDILNELDIQFKGRILSKQDKEKLLLVSEGLFFGKATK